MILNLLLSFLFLNNSPAPLCICEIAVSNGSSAGGKVTILYESAGGGCSNPNPSSGTFHGYYLNAQGGLEYVSGDADPDVCLTDQGGGDDE
jgi:hypothetical protein